MSVCLSLPEIPADYAGVVVGSYSVISVAPKCETAGYAFFERVERPRLEPVVVEEGEESSESPKSSSDSDLGESADPKKKNYKEHSSIAQRVRQTLEGGDDLYELICLPHSATLEDIKKQWKKLALVFHPDKTTKTRKGHAVAGLPDVSRLTAEQLHEQFLKRHNAFEILVDPVMRRQYDSYVAFDDRLPSEHDIKLAAAASPEAFFALCSQAFDKEARWCVKQPVPPLGDMRTPLEEVKDFYKYWANYESWRDFTNAGEFHLEEAQDREERKWMQKENWKVVKGMLKAERLRVLRFVAAVEVRDPRLLQAKERLRQAKAKTTAPARTPKAAAAAKAKALLEAKAAVLARRKKLGEGRSAVRQVVRDWIGEKLELKDEAFNANLDKFLATEDASDAISDLVQKLNNLTKRYKEPTADGAREVKTLIEREIASSSL